MSQIRTPAMSAYQPIVADLNVAMVAACISRASTKGPALAYFRRLGRRFSIPSTVQILHELRALSADEDMRMRCADEHDLPETTSWEEIIAHRVRLEAESGPRSQ
jgi:hypothetical protein